MNSSFQRMQERARQAEERAKEQPQESDSIPNILDSCDSQMDLPIELLGNGARGAPDSVLRSALFAGNRPGKRRYIENEQIASVSNVIIRQTGPQLHQIDLDVWIELIRLAAEEKQPVIRTPLKALLRRMNWDTGAKARERLLSTLRRLNATVVGISDGLRDYDGSLIVDHSRDEKQQLVIQLNPKVAKLFDRSSWSTLQLQQRHNLKRQPLAQWLHGYLSSHAKPYPIKVATLHTLSGSNAKAMHHFRAELRDAMDKVAKVTGWTWELDRTDKLVVIKTNISANCE